MIHSIRGFHRWMSCSVSFSRVATNINAATLSRSFASETALPKLPWGSQFGPLFILSANYFHFKPGKSEENPLIPKASKLEAQAWVLQTAWVVFSTRDKVNQSFRPQASVLPAAWLLMPGKNNIDLLCSTVLCVRTAAEA